jgi:hypothetical protein
MAIEEGRMTTVRTRGLLAVGIVLASMLFVPSPAKAICPPDEILATKGHCLDGDVTAVLRPVSTLRVKVGFKIDILRKIKKSAISLSGIVVRKTDVDGTEHDVTQRRVPAVNAGASTTPEQSTSPPPECTTSYYGSGFTAYSNFYSWTDSSMGFVEYRYAPFTQENARYLANEGWTWQLETCAIGGGVSAGGWRLTEAGHYMTLQESAPRVINFAAYSGSAVSPDYRSLNFTIDAKVIKVSGSIGINANHVQRGGQGRQYRASPYDDYGQNGIFQFWDGHDSPENNYQGSDDFEGNVSHGLWEFPMSKAGTVIQGAVWLQAQCPWWRDCA